jgi:integrase
VGAARHDARRGAPRDPARRAFIGRTPTEHVLTSEAGESGWQLGPWVLERAVRAARPAVKGLPAGFRFHDLRHYLASLLIASGANVKVVQARLRHASATTTLDCYGHLLAR